MSKPLSEAERRFLGQFAQIDREARGLPSEWGHTPTWWDRLLHRFGVHSWNWFWYPRPICVICGVLKVKGRQ